MKNLHQKSDLISREEITNIEKALEEAWSAETTFPGDKKTWTKDNKALGQCLVTAVIIYDLFGGRMIYDKANFHVWNELPDGSQQDFTRTQFKAGTKFAIYKYKTKDEVLFDNLGRSSKAFARYKLLKAMFLAIILHND